MSHPVENLKTTYNLLALDSKTADFLGKFYVRREATEMRELLTSIQIKHQPTRILFAGHRGSGKTSELRYLKSMLEQEPTLVIFVSTIEDLNLANVHYTEILLAVVDNVIDLLYDIGVTLDGTLIKRAEKLLAQLAGDLVVESTSSSSHGYGLSAFFKVIGANIRRDFDTREVLRNNVTTIISDILEVTNELISSAQEQTNKQILIIVDDLEKVTSRKQITEIFEGFSLVINKLDCHFVLTLPTSVIHSTETRQIRIDYCKTVMLPLFAIKKPDGTDNETEIQEMEIIANKRIIGNSIPPDVLRQAALYSGGLIQDFLRLLEGACLKAITNGKYKLSHDLLDESFAELSNEYKVSIEARQIPLLKKIHETKSADMDDDVKQLLFSLALLEYIDRDSRGVWYDLHPAVVKAFEPIW